MGTQKNGALVHLARLDGAAGSTSALAGLTTRNVPPFASWPLRTPA